MSFTESHNAQEKALLLKAVRSGEFQFIVIRQNHSSIVEQVADLLSKAYPTRKLSHIQLPLPPDRSLGREIIAQESGFFLIDRFQNILQDDRARVVFNQQRDRIARLPLALIAFVPQDQGTLQRLQKGLPDFWSIRNLEIELAFLHLTNEEHRDFSTLNIQHSTGRPEEQKSELERLRQRFWDLENDSTARSYRAIIAGYIAGIAVQLGDEVLAEEWLARAKELS